jgi:hypothetical protein
LNTTSAVPEITTAQINALGPIKMEYLNQTNAAKLNGDVTDWLYSKGYTLLTGGGATVSGIETSKTVLAGTGTKKIVAGKSAVNITGSASSETIDGSTAADIITGAGGADAIDGHEGNDTFNYLLTADLFATKAAVDSVTGGDGNDIITIGTTGTAFTIANDDIWTRFNTIETIKTNANTKAVTVALDVSAATAGVNKVDLSLVTGIGADKSSIDVSEFSTDTILLGATTTGIVDITGGSGNDIITAAAGGGTITAGGGLDKMMLGAGADIVVLGTIADSLDTISRFTGGSNGDKIQLGGTTAAVGKTIAEIAATTETASVVFSNLTAAKTITIAGVTITAGAVDVTAATIAAGFENLAAGAVPNIAGATVGVGQTLTGWTTGAKSTATVVFTSTTASTDVSPNLVDTGNGAAAAVTVTPGGVTYAGIAHNIVYDTAAHLGVLGVNIGDHSALSETSALNYAVASDTGAIYYDANGNWTSGSIQIGTIGIVAGLTAADNFTVA